MRRASVAATFMLALLAAGCADTPSTTPADPSDPYEAWNRRIFEMNMDLDARVMKPTAEAYVDVVPEFARNGIHNALVNFGAPVTFTNDVLQGEPESAGETLGRFLLNSTAGVGGLVDLATPAGIPYHDSDFGQTLGVWGVGPGPYLMLPLLGPDDPRDLLGTVADSFMDPLEYAGIRDYVYWSIGREAVNIVDTRAQNLESLDQLKKSSVDFYAATRSLYRQYRASKVRHGKADVTNLPEM